MNFLLVLVLTAFVSSGDLQSVPDDSREAVVSAGDAVSDGNAADLSESYIHVVSGGDVLESISAGVSQAVDSNLGDINSSLEELNEKMDALTYALAPSINAMQLPEYYVNYFRGVLQNMGYTEYLAYSTSVYSAEYRTNITHYYMYYDLTVVDGTVVSGNYPVIDVWYYNSIYHVDEITRTFSGYPTIGYASFLPYSALLDRSFDVRYLIAGLVLLLAFYLLCRKTVFS